MSDEFGRIGVGGYKYYCGSGNWFASTNGTGQMTTKYRTGTSRSMTAAGAGRATMYIVNCSGGGHILCVVANKNLQVEEETVRVCLGLT